MVSSPAEGAWGWQGGESAGRGGRWLVAAWWLSVAWAGTFITIFSLRFLPPKFSLDATIVRSYLDAPDLWAGVSYDSFVNTARLWSLVFEVVPPAVAVPAYYLLVVAATVRVLNVFEVHEARYHLLSGAWVTCSALFLSFPNKEMIALPVALWLCTAGSRGTRFLATLVFLVYAAFFRQYWFICYFYYACTLLALRMHVAHRSRLALCILVVAWAAPFALAGALNLEPLTDARTTVNADRVDSPDARSAFDNTFDNTGFATDIANAVIAWPYMNVPVHLLARTEPHYIFFAAFQLCSLWFFAAGCARFLKDARQLRMPGSTYLRCTAFVIAYSMTQSIFEPDFGSFLRHEVVFMIPMLVVAFYRAHAKRVRERQPMDLAYGRHASAHV